jgi:Ca-activated chloride channel family protein
VVNLSIRYGIITPYTSYLIEEDDIFNQLGREQIIEDVINDAESRNEASFFGADAVEEAEALSDMSAAEAPAAVEVTRVVSEATEGDVDQAASKSNQPIQIIGSKTFVNRQGVWIDTAYDDTLSTEQVGFASDSYFELLSAAPELGQYLALGEQLIVVFDGIAYEIIPGETSAAITPPDPASDPEVAVLTPAVSPENTTSDNPQPELIIEEPFVENAPLTADQTAGSEQPIRTILIAGIIIALLGGLGIGLRLARKK